MAVIAVINRKGGVGKSTLATHLAGYLASLGLDVMLGDVDKQQSSRLWLSLRPETLPRIRGWIFDERNFARPPAGVKHVVLDTPAGLHGMALMKIAMSAEAIIIPAMTSVFDRASAEESIRELRTFPRIASGKCKLACIGMRIDSRTRNAALLQDWAAGQSLQFLGTIRALQAYSQCLERGLTMFDLPPAKVGNCLPEWAMLTDWLHQTLVLPGAVTESKAPESEPDRPAVVQAISQPVQKSVQIAPKFIPVQEAEPTLPDSVIPEFLRR